MPQNGPWDRYKENPVPGPWNNYGGQQEQPVSPFTSGQITGISAAPPRSALQRIKDALTSAKPYSGTLDAPGKSVAEISGDIGKGAAFAIPTALVITNPIAAIKSMIGGAFGAGAGGYIGREAGRPFGIGDTTSKIGAVVGGLAGAYGLNVPHGKVAIWKKIITKIAKNPDAEVTAAEQSTIRNILLAGERIDPMPVQRAGSAAQATAGDLQRLANAGDLSARLELIRRRLPIGGAPIDYSKFPLPKP